MLRRWVPVVTGLVASIVLAGCGGGDGGGTSEGGQATASTAAARVTTTTRPQIEGVQTYKVEPSHSAAPVSYPEVPPVGGAHDPKWTPCTFYDRSVPNEMTVHSLEHGAIWVTYRPDLAQAEIDVLAALARSRKDVVASRWDEGLPAPLVATGWGRQLRLQSAADPRLAEFVRTYANQGPEPNAPC